MSASHPDGTPRDPKAARRQRRYALAGLLLLIAALFAAVASRSFSAQEPGAQGEEALPEVDIDLDAPGDDVAGVESSARNSAAQASRSAAVARVAGWGGDDAEVTAVKGSAVPTVAARGWPATASSQLVGRQLRLYKMYALTGFRNKATTDFKILTAFLATHKSQASGSKGGCATFDVGANLGKYSLDLMELPVTRGCTVWAFEPNPLVHARLQKAVAKYRNIRPLNVGVGAEPANLTFYYKPGDTHDTGGSFSADNARGTSSVERATAQVEVITIDRLLKAEVPADTPIPLVKIDVEGLEKQVKLGMREALASGRVAAVYWERQGAYELEPFEEEIAFMARYGYACYIIGSIPPRAGVRWGKHSARPVLVRVDGPYYHKSYEPKLYRGPGRGGPGTGKPIAINLLAVQAEHPFNAVAKKSFSVL